MLQRFFCFILCLIFLGPTNLNSQHTDPSLKALNNYIQFSNESTHGLLIIHRLLENFNQEINKFVDLASFQINFYSNKDLPRNIFIDEEHWFYEVTPEELFQIAIDESSLLPEKERNALNSSARRLRSICNTLNQARFDIEEYIEHNDLTLVEHQQEVYNFLERCVDGYDNFFEEQQQLLSLIRDLYNSRFAKANDSYSDIYGRMMFIHKSSMDIFNALRSKETGNFQNSLNELEKHTSSFQRLSSFKSDNFLLRGRKFQQLKDKIESKSQLLLERARFFFEDGGVPEEYKLYGKFYYFHNSDLINKFNRYGNGFVSDMNQIISLVAMPVLYFSETPHFYQVIYPEKLDKEDHITSSDDDIEQLPTKLRERNIVTNTRKIVVDSVRLEINIYDHKIQDGDIISLNFNGDWILENQSIENKPMTIKLKLNESGKNYLLLHAVNLGRRPPNTLGISYYFKGEKKEIILESDLNASEMIEIDIAGT